MSTHRGNAGLLFLMVFCVVLVLAFLWLFYSAPHLNIGPEQPIPFSHRVHAGVKEISCRFCHPYVEQSTHPGIPPVEKCLYCHEYIIPKHPEILKEHNYFNSNTPTPWRKVNYMPEHVFFNHQRHLERNFECEECHDAVETKDRLQTNRFRMGFCITCHTENNANKDCWLACHN